MFARVSNVVLMIAVLVLSVALVRTSRRPESNSTNLGAAVQSREDASERSAAIMTAALLSTFEPLDMSSEELDWSGAKANVNAVAMNRPAIRQPQAAGDTDPKPESANQDAGDRPWMHRPRLTPELIARCIEVAKEVDSELGSRLADARDRNPADFDGLMRQGGVGRRLMAMAQLKQHDPDIYKQKVEELSNAVQIDRVAKQLREAKSTGSQGSVDRHLAELRPLVQRQLLLSIKARGDTLCRLEDRIAELRKELERDALNFTSIIEARMKLLANAPMPADAAPSVEQQDKSNDQPAASPTG